MDVGITIELSDVPGSKTTIIWKADAPVGALIAGVGQKLMGTATEKTVNELVERLRSKLEKTRMHKYYYFDNCVNFQEKVEGWCLCRR